MYRAGKIKTGIRRATPRFLRTGFRRALGELNYADLKRWYRPTGWPIYASYYDDLTRLIMQRADGSVGSLWVDVGAHRGDILLDMIAIATRCEVSGIRAHPRILPVTARPVSTSSGLQSCIKRSCG
jgi:hypothetical protein